VLLPPSLTVTAIEPSSVRIRLDEVIVKKIPVRPELAGSLPRGYAIAGIKVEPPFVEIEGLRSQISRIKYIPTEQILLDNLTVESSLTVLLEPGINYIKLNPESVRVKIILRRER
jgi:YbbR domain-containing protein